MIKFKPTTPRDDEDEERRGLVEWSLVVALIVVVAVFSFNQWNKLAQQPHAHASAESTPR